MIVGQRGRIVLQRVVFVLLGIGWAGWGYAGSSGPAFVPWPKSLHMQRGELTLGKASRIVAESPALAPLAKILADEIRLKTGLELAAGSGRPDPGDIGLALDPALTNEAHRVTVTDRVTVLGGNYVGAGMGTVSVLQAVRVEDGKVTLPKLTVLDWPFATYTGMMLDVARQFNSIETLKQCVVLARLYKMKYFHLHMTDDQLFTFPSAKYPKLKGVYTLAELKDLVKFADERGVTIIPEMEMPGHSSQLSDAFTDVFCDSQGCVINFLNPGGLTILADLVNEMCGVFRSSPYFHMGSDECNWALFETWPNVVEDRKANKRDTGQQHGWLINEINKVVKKQGKSLIVWEGFDGPEAGVDKDVIVMEWDGRFFPPREVAAAGYKMINVPWVPSIAATARENYEWNMWLLGSQDRTPDQFVRGTPEAGLVIGGQMVLWECGGDSALPQLRATAIPRHERIHSPDAGKTYADFDRRFKATDQLLDLLLHSFAVKAEGLLNSGDSVFDQALVLTVDPSPALKQAVVRYTLDGKKPDMTSPVFAGPLRVTGSTQVNMQAFDANGREAGYPRLTKYAFRPLTGTLKGLLTQERFRQNRYADPVTVTLRSAVGGEIRYTADGSEVSLASAKPYSGPVKIDSGSLTVRAAVFLNGTKQGEEWSEDLLWVNYEKNLTTGKKAAAGQGLPQDTPTPAAEFQAGNLALNGSADKDNHWSLNPYPAWLKVDLEKAAKIDRLQLYCWWGDDRSYKYTIDLSVDDVTWKRVVDASQNTQQTSDQGYRHTFAPTQARYIRVTMLENTANSAVHICELRAYKTK
ncbi:MAG: family 20 glycosylhydrolase [bacterium]